MFALYILVALLGWFGGNYAYSQLPTRFKEKHPPSGLAASSEE
jgi:hypothetical protein